MLVEVLNTPKIILLVFQFPVKAWLRGLLFVSATEVYLGGLFWT